MKRALAFLVLVIAAIFPAAAQEYYDIGVDLPQYPEMQPVEDSPVYYAPGVDSNYFYYDGQYWDYSNDAWYTSAWYNGPWAYVEPIYVPTYVLWVPIRFYRRPPVFFRRWNPNAPPRWADRWGRNWQVRHNEIFGGQHARQPVRAPLPDYQRQFNRANYPRPQQQAAIHAQHYSYRPWEGGARRQEHAGSGAREQ